MDCIFEDGILYSNYAIKRRKFVIKPETLFEIMRIDYSFWYCTEFLNIVWYVINQFILDPIIISHFSKYEK